MKKKRKSQELRAWCWAYDWANKHGYGYDDLKDLDKPSVRSRRISQSIRDCRMIAMAYEMGWKNGRKSKRWGRKQHRFTQHGGSNCVDCGVHRSYFRRACFPLPGHEPPPDAGVRMTRVRDRR